VNDHINNAVAFDALYEISHLLDLSSPTQVVIEYHRPIDSHGMTQLYVRPTDSGFDAWLVNDKNIAAAMTWK
jgi:acyl-ACP thioesterase